MHRVLHAFRRRNNVDEAFVFVSFESALHELSLSFNEDRVLLLESQDHFKVPSIHCPVSVLLNNNTSQNC